MRAFDQGVTTNDADEMLRSSFTEFVAEVEPRLKKALCVGLGIERGVEATAEALAYGWEHWDRIRAMSNPAGYLYRVGRTRGRPRPHPGPLFPHCPPESFPWIEPGLPEALARLSEPQRVAVWLVLGFGWTLDETASLLDVSISTVRTHLKRGEKKLRKDLGVST
jgi:DNA-directed RNA polymerase specialized sigma24 family protein